MHILEFEKPIYELEARIEELSAQFQAHPEEQSEKDLRALQSEKETLRNQIYTNLSPWEKTQIARHPERISTDFFVKYCCKDFVELHGDRHFADDPSILCGLAKIGNLPFMVIGHLKGSNLQENVVRNFGMPHPEGYRKALRMMKLAEKFDIPILTLIDTPGAYPGVGAEERNQSEAIALNLQEMSDLKVPSISIVTGEGGSGGAIALGVTNKVLMLEHAVYSVISPEGCASILWFDAKKAKKAANTLKYTASFLLELKVIDDIVVEPVGGAHNDLEMTGNNMVEKILAISNELSQMSSEELVAQRYEKFRNIGVFEHL